MVRAGRRVLPRLSPLLICAWALSGCVSTSPTSDASITGGADVQTAGPGQRVIERDVEAPNVFQVEDTGLWDGRPSLGGVWVAHPSVEDPERALIRNSTTGATVIGALFRRERENPGPLFQISSEAANALGILPGAPTEVSVTALRLQRVELEIDPAPEPTTAAAETLAIAPVAPPAPAPVAAPTGGSTTAPAGAPVDQVEIISEEPPRRSLRDLFRRRTPAPEADAIAETTLAPAIGAATVATAPLAAPVADPLADPTVVAPTAVVEPPSERRSLRDLFRRREPEPDTTMIALPDAGAAGDTPAAPQPQGPRLDRPFVQIGIFSVEQNAQNARSQMQRAGLSAEIRRGRVGENLFWRVVVGPAGTTSERADILRRVRGMGFADAYTVVR